MKPRVALISILGICRRNQRGHAKAILLGAWHRAVTHKCSESKGGFVGQQLSVVML